MIMSKERTRAVSLKIRDSRLEREVRSFTVEVRVEVTVRKLSEV